MSAETALGAAGKVLRFGSNDSHPYNYWDEEGIHGFAVEIAERAAAIAGYRIEWIRVDGLPEKAFEETAVDFWPFATIFPDRTGKMYLTEPWWRLPTVLYFPEASPIRSVRELADKRISIPVPMDQYVFDMQRPAGIQYLRRKTSEAAFQDLCVGASDVAWIDLRDIGGLALNRPKGCETMRMGALVPKGGERRFGMAARFGFEREAKRLRQGIDTMAETGELIEIANRWGILNTSDSVLFFWVSNARTRSQELRFLVWGIGTAVLITAVFMLRLRSARQTAEQNAAARSLFLANMSHEIRTPMNGILGMTELTLRTELNNDQRHCLEMVHSSARGLLTVINDVLDFSRIDSGRLPLESIPFDLRAVATTSFELFRHAGEGKGLAMRLNLSPSLEAGYRGDPARIQQVLINLIGNAIKFTERGSITVHVAARTGGVVCAVEDTGLGIRKEDQTKIFDAFTQADSSFTRRFGGTGLGLSICSRLVKLMGGELLLDSEEGRGSTFRFLLPLEPAVLERALEKEPGEAPGRALRLLVAEDNHVNQALMLRLLEKAGHKVKIVADGGAALTAMRAERFDAVLMDVHMPVLDGLEATRRLRAEERLRGEHLPVIALTALALTGDAQRCFDAGMDAYLSKPVNTKELLALLRNIDAMRAPQPAASSD